jgi:hypothetical protein
MFAQVKKIILFASLPMLFVGAALAAGRPDYGGKMSLTVVKQEARPLDAAGHVVAAEVIKGTNVSTGRIAWMDGSDVLLSEIADLDKGNGTAHGVGSHVKDGVSMPFSYVDTVKTVMVDGGPLTTAEGPVTPLTKSPMKNVTVKCTFTSQTTLECEWRGDAIKNAAN